MSQIKTRDDLKQLWDDLKSEIENDPNSPIEFSDLPVDNHCTNPDDTSAIWSWAEPCAELDNYPKYVLAGDGGLGDWEIYDLTELQPDEWPRSTVITEQ